ncbi:hypothetical protein QQP08_018034 [Theobroma cacao]|nr:hypothetical protein QQP08_018034 [Theobroma cacao]
MVASTNNWLKLGKWLWGGLRGLGRKTDWIEGIRFSHESFSIHTNGPNKSLPCFTLSDLLPVPFPSKAQTQPPPTFRC